MTRKWLPLEQVKEYKTTIANKLKLEQLENITIEINNCIANTRINNGVIYSCTVCQRQEAQQIYPKPNKTT